MNIHPIAYIKTDFSSKFGIPRQSGLIDTLEGEIHFIGPYKNPDYLRGIEDYSYLWLIWEFSENKNISSSPMVRPPRLGGNVKKGVFATRSPYRPNALGLSSVRLTRVDLAGKEGPVLYIQGADLLDGTPIYDIKPYLAFADSHPDAGGGFADPVFYKRLEVTWEKSLVFPYSHQKKAQLLEILAQDPRPSYQNDPERIYGMEFAGYDIHFKVNENILTLLDFVPISQKN